MSGRQIAGTPSQAVCCRLQPEQERCGAGPGSGTSPGRFTAMMLFVSLLLLDPAAQAQAQAQAQEQTAAAAQPAEEEGEYSGELLSLDFQDVDLRTVLQILADENDVNLVVSDSVSGRVTLRLQDVPWEQILSTLLHAHGLDRRMLGNILYIAPAAEIAEQDQQLLRSNRQLEAHEPLQTAYVQVNYADASALLALLRGSEAAQEPGAEQAGMLSERGYASVDVRTNTLIIRDVASIIEQVHELLSRLDVAVRQVLIEARIVNVGSDYGRELGARWSGRAIQLSPDSAEQAPLRSGFDRLSLDLGVHSDRAGVLAFTAARNSTLIELELSAMENSGKGEVIARPRVTTQDNVAATIQSGVRIPYQAQAGGTAGGSITQFVDAVLRLEVTPQITPDGRIVMRLNIHQDSVAAGSGAVPAINTNAISTSVLVDDGGTLVLGGIFREEFTNTEIKTPLLGDLPYLGRLFRRSSSASRRLELLIFITPQIVAVP